MRVLRSAIGLSQNGTGPVAVDTKSNENTREITAALTVLSPKRKYCEIDATRASATHPEIRGSGRGNCQPAHERPVTCGECTAMCGSAEPAVSRPRRTYPEMRSLPHICPSALSPSVGSRKSTTICHLPCTLDATLIFLPLFDPSPKQRDFGKHN
jgi:hypothetical protein